MKRPDLLEALASSIAARTVTHPLRVAIDGIDASGKTTLADALVSPLEAHGRPVIRASIDGFHRPRAHRYQRGATSPGGCYLDSFDNAALRDVLLLPLGPNGSRRYRHAIFDYRTNRPALAPEQEAPPTAVLLVDGVFLLRPELVAFWDYCIFVEVPFATALERAMRRDVALFGSNEAVQTRYHQRYIPGQHLYFETAHPQEHADAIVYNEALDDPRLFFRHV